MDCIGCGIQRAFIFFINGEFIAAFKMFPALYSTLLLFIFLGLHCIDKSRNYHKIIIGLAIANALIMIIAYIYKLSTII